MDAFASKDIPHWACTIKNSVREKKSLMKALLSVTVRMPVGDQFGSIYETLEHSSWSQLRVLSIGKSRLRS